MANPYQSPGAAGTEESSRLAISRAWSWVLIGAGVGMIPFAILGGIGGWIVAGPEYADAPELYPPSFSDRLLGCGFLATLLGVFGGIFGVALALVLLSLRKGVVWVLHRVTARRGLIEA